MKHFIHAVTVFTAFTFSQIALLSCQNQDEASIIAEPETVNVTFSDVIFTVEDDNLQTRATSVSADSAGVNRISLSVYDSRNNLKFSSQKSASVNTEDFDKITCKLIPGAYTFVAVAHKANADSEKAATINSQFEAILTTAKVSRTYKAVQPVTVVKEGANNITIAFGQRITSTFQIKIADSDYINTINIAEKVRELLELKTSSYFKRIEFSSCNEDFMNDTYRQTLQFIAII